jgi:hypothetical protein
MKKYLLIGLLVVALALVSGLVWMHFLPMPVCHQTSMHHCGDWPRQVQSSTVKHPGFPQH